jgi:uncharacterized protein (DUF169 family)
MMLKHDYATIDHELRGILGLGAPPIAITFTEEPPAGIEPYGSNRPYPTPDGRTGSVPAGCVFWMRATDREFATTAVDHGNCSVGSYTHGFKTLPEAAGNADVQSLLAVEWMTMESAMGLPTVSQKRVCVVYGPLAKTSVDPDVVFLRLNGKQLMLLNDALPNLRFEGKPQCHIIPIAREEKVVAISSGCMLSRVRTGMSNNEVTCAIPVERLNDLLVSLKKAREADFKVAAYAAEDAKRFR